MTQFVINLFVPYAYEGTISAVLANICANERNGEVRVTRCGEVALNDRINDLVNAIGMAEEEGAEQPKHREIWVIGFPNGAISEATSRRLMALPNSVEIMDAESPMDALWTLATMDPAISYDLTRIQTLHFVMDTKLNNRVGNNFLTLYMALGAEKFEKLVAELVLHCDADRFDPGEDPTIRAFLNVDNGS